MSRFLVDEDMPRSLAPALRDAGFDAQDVRDVGLRGGSDAQILRRAVADDRAVVTGDLGYANLLTVPLGSHRGIVVARLANELPVATVNEVIVGAIRSLSAEELGGCLVIVEPSRIRLRRPQ